MWLSEKARSGMVQPIDFRNNDSILFLTKYSKYYDSIQYLEGLKTRLGSPSRRAQSLHSRGFFWENIIGMARSDEFFFST